MLKSFVPCSGLVGGTFGCSSHSPRLRQGKASYSWISLQRSLYNFQVMVPSGPRHSSFSKRNVSCSSSSCTNPKTPHPQNKCTLIAHCYPDQSIRLWPPASPRSTGLGSTPPYLTSRTGSSPGYALHVHLLHFCPEIQSGRFWRL